MRLQVFFQSAVTSLIVLASVGVASARGDILVSNLTATQANADTVSGQSAQGFVTGGSAWTVSSIEAALGGVGGDPNAINASATLYASKVVGGVDTPDTSTALATFSFPALDIGYLSRTFTPTTSELVLQANTEYWFVLNNLKGTAAPFQWVYTKDTTSGSSYGGLLTTLRTSSDGGASWSSPADSYSYLLQVNGAPLSVPEPSTLAISALGFLMILALEHRLRRAPVAE